jgi:catechol 2,3-dioxygenase-like lactoylglutathione lyase family enzyme
MLRSPSADRFYRDDQDECFGPAVGAARIWPITMEHMSIKRMEHVGIVVDDLAAAAEFLSSLDSCCKARGPSRVAGWTASWGLRRTADSAMIQTPDGHSRLELTKFHSPSSESENQLVPANTPGICHTAFAVEDIEAIVARLRTRGSELVGKLESYEDAYRLCYVRGRRV